MDKKRIKPIKKKESENPQFVAFGKNINKFAATAVIIFLLLVITIIIVIILAYFLQEQ